MVKKKIIKGKSKPKSRKKKIMKVIKKAPSTLVPVLSPVELLCLEYKIKNDL